MSTMTTTQEAQMQGTYRIPEHAIIEVERTVNKLNKRAAKLGLEPVVLTDTAKRESVMVELPGVNAFGEKVTQEQVWAIVEVSGGLVKLADWSFVATIEHTEAGNILRRIPGDERDFDLSAYRNTGRVCDHCRLDRKRNDTFIVAHTDGRLAQVGSNCLLDFCGEYSRDPHALVKYFEGVYNIFSSLDSGIGYDEGGSPRVENSVSIEGFVSVTMAAVHEHGWMSRGKAYDFGGIATADIVWDAFFARDMKDWKPWRPSQEQYDAGVVEAEPMIAWARSLEDTDNDYLQNLHVACLNSQVTRRRAGIVASLYVAYQRAMEQELELQRRAGALADKRNEHVGQVGDKLEGLELTCVSRRETEGYYGMTTILTFEDAEGISYKWFASRSQGVDKGDKVILKGTIKKHDEYKGRKSTVLTRCKMEVR
jgi:hypothetical protein